VNATVVGETFRSSQLRRPPPLLASVRDGSWPSELVDTLADKVAKSCGRIPRRLGAEPGGGLRALGVLLRGPHARQDGRSLAVAAGLRRCPAPGVASFFSARLVGVPKSSGGFRVLGSGNVLRRLLGRALAKEFLNSIKAAVVICSSMCNQTAQGSPAGCSLRPLLCGGGSLSWPLTSWRLPRACAGALPFKRPVMPPTFSQWPWLLSRGSHHVAPDPNGGPSSIADGGPDNGPGSGLSLVPRFLLGHGRRALAES
jgi:hypothetical protein